VWWLDYTVRGERHRESSGTTSKRDAQRIMRDRMGSRETGKMVGHPDRVTLHHLRELVRIDYELNGLRSWAQAMRWNWEHLERVLGADEPAVRLDVARCDAYAQARLAEGAARATVNRELAALRRGFRLAVRKGLLATRPEFVIPQEHNARSGFFEESDFRAVQLALPEALRPLVEFAYLTGWRRKEILTLTWANVDLNAEVLRLEVGTTKNREGRTFPYGVLPALKALIDAQWQRRDGLFVFHRHGARIRDYYTAWHNACARAAVQGGVIVRPALLGRIPHDFRRTAVRNLERAGVPRSVAMQLTGHKTEAVYRRYAIVAEQDQREGVEKLAANTKTNGKRATSRRAHATKRDRVSSSAA